MLTIKMLTIDARKWGVLGALAGVVLAGCATVKVEAPDEPIEINLNVNVSGEVLVRLEEEVDDLIASNPDIF